MGLYPKYWASNNEKKSFIANTVSHTVFHFFLALLLVRSRNPGNGFTQERF